MKPHLLALVEQYKEDLRKRDGGLAARRTYLRIKSAATLKELIKILEDVYQVI